MQIKTHSQIRIHTCAACACQQLFPSDANAFNGSQTVEESSNCRLFANTCTCTATRAKINHKHIHKYTPIQSILTHDSCAYTCDARSHCNIFQHTVPLQHTVAHCNTLQTTATHCNTPAHTHATHAVQTQLQHQHRSWTSSRTFANCMPPRAPRYIYTCIYM